MPGVGQDIDAALGGSTRAPIMTAYRQQALACASALSQGPRRVRDLRPDIPDAPKILLHNVYGWFDRAERGIALAALVLGDQARALFRVASRARRRRLDDHLNIAGVGDREHAEAEPATEVAISRIALAALAARR